MSYFSEPLIVGLAVGGAVQVLMNQLSELTNINIPSSCGPGNIFRNFNFLIQEYIFHSKNGQEGTLKLQGSGIALLAAILTIIIIYLVKTIDNKIIGNQNKERLQSLRINSTSNSLAVTRRESTCSLTKQVNWKNYFLFYPIPGEPVALLILTLICFAWKLHDRFDLQIVGSIKEISDFPFTKFSIPPHNTRNFLYITMINVAIGYVASFSMTKVIADFRNYKVDANQEFIALGLANILSAFCGGIPCFLNLGRTIVSWEMGSNSQLSNLVSILIMYVLKKLTESLDLLKFTPKACLAAMCCHSVFAIYSHLKDIKKLFKIDRLDAFV